MDPLTIRRCVVRITTLCLLLFTAVATFAQEPAKAIKKEKPLISTQKLVEQGIAIEFTVTPKTANASVPRAAEDANVEFKISDTTSGTPVNGLHLSAWISRREGEKAPDASQCRAKIQSYLTGSLQAQPDVDVNSYYILALNKSADISVIDPLLGFGGSKLLTLVMMKSPGEDWVLTRDGELLFVTLPLIDQIAVIGTRSWKVLNYIDVVAKPTRILVQPDQQYVWVANDGDKDGGVTVIDMANLKVAAKISTGAGEHELVI